MHVYTSSSVVICSHCTKPGYRDQICFARTRNKSMGKLVFLARKHAWCSLHRTNQHNSAYIVQRRGDKHGTSRHHRFGQQNDQRNFDRVNNAGGRLQPCCISIVIVSSSHQILFLRSFIALYNHRSLTAASTRSTATGVPVQLFFHLQLHGLLRLRLLLLLTLHHRQEASATRTSQRRQNDTNINPIYIPLLTSSPSTISFLKAPVFGGHGTAARRGQHGNNYDNCSTCINMEQTTYTAEATKFVSNYCTT